SHPECFDDELNNYMQKDDNPFGFKELQYIRKVEASKALNQINGPCIIISASGMANAGRIQHHLYNNIENPRNTVLMIGYCSPNTPGGQLRSGSPFLHLFGENLHVNAEVVTLDSFSAHGDKVEMLDFLSNQKESVEKLYLVHGTLDRQEKFKEFLHENSFKDILIPELEQSFIID
ncbi:MAG: MBL fold metallo-hydrolase, partial [Saprospiraceae bacterium]|nr:MBL fold metallo-hydrolase [Saprospiraceae bacterium]